MSYYRELREAERVRALEEQLEGAKMAAVKRTSPAPGNRFTRALEEVATERDTLREKVAELEGRTPEAPSEYWEAELARLGRLLESRDERIAEIERQLAAATALLAMLDRLYPPPKLPTTDEEIIEALIAGLPANAAIDPRHKKSIDQMFVAIDALRARLAARTK